MDKITPVMDTFAEAPLPDGPIYEVNVASKMGHETLKLNLDGAVDRIFKYFRENRMWAVINDGIFKTSATFNGTSSDNQKIEADKIRLRDLLSSLTSVDVAFPDKFIVPPVQVVSRLVGGNS